MDRWAGIGLLLIGVVGAIGLFPRIPTWVVPVAAGALDIVIGVISPSESGDAVRVLLSPVGFLLCAVPMSVLLDQLGVFGAMARRMPTRPGRRAAGYLWALAALVTTFLNLDAAVVLLTPLYVNIARQNDWDVLGLGVQPVLLACLASSALPVSNLTNLIAASWTGAGTVQFVTHLGLPSLAATVVGWWAYRRVLEPSPAHHASQPATLSQERSAGREPVAALPVAARSAPAGSREAGAVGEGSSARATAASTPGHGGEGTTGPEEATARSSPRAWPGAPVERKLWLAGLVVLAVLIGFTFGYLGGVEPWEVALGADAVLLVVLGQARKWDRGPRTFPWRSVPAETAAVVLSLGVLASGAARHIPVGRFFGSGSLASTARDAGVAAAAANAVNNLPALLVSLGTVGHRTSPRLWSVLVGVNMGPVLLVTGSLASLLWLATMRRLGVPVKAAHFTRFGVRVGLPAAAAGLGVLLLMQVVGLG